MRQGLKDKSKDQQLIAIEYWIALLAAVYTLYDIRAEPTTLLKYFIANVQQGYYITSRLIYHHTNTFTSIYFPQDHRSESHLWTDMIEPEELYTSLGENRDTFKECFDD